MNSVRGYQQGFFGCLNNPIVCLASCFCTCCTVGYAVGQVNSTSFDLWSCLCPHIGMYRLRRTVQTKYGINESEDASMVATACLGCCSVAQDTSEVLARNGGGSASQPSSVSNMEA
ncbi:hypothetical protein H696_05171 [Fonticula alba]|uniref:PLAC8 family protein n=1 Tax=Fonticula alba TaxID=691883 RepID=A0A058Z2T6_FONAL|nr:hypothetical protein H696_05171 [Fonticula alba]KCV68248.1 hypothetical protein H696_05171 [Fonticula alba]|eukprot:XP_009497302.1 hypothetical protein H696_05171 [Fonticula alba]